MSGKDDTAKDTGKDTAQDAVKDTAQEPERDLAEGQREDGLVIEPGEALDRDLREHELPDRAEQG
jgi:hypothetical protein